jgi:hypothetical protein
MSWILNIVVFIASYIITSTITFRGSAVVIVISQGLDDQDPQIPSEVKNFHFTISSRSLLESTQPSIQWVPGAPSPGMKRQGLEADHSPPNSV